MVYKVQFVQSTNNDNTGKYKTYATYSGTGRPSGPPGPSNLYRLFPRLVGTAIVDRLIEMKWKGMWKKRRYSDHSQ